MYDYRSTGTIFYSLFAVFFLHVQNETKKQQQNFSRENTIHSTDSICVCEWVSIVKCYINHKTKNGME